MNIKSLLLSTTLIFGLGSILYAEDTTDFIRYKPGTEVTSGLQVAVTEYVSSSTTVTLYGVVHVADADYYQKVQSDLDKFDTVLYEGVKSGTKTNPETKALNTVQKLMGNVLDLKFQKDSIDYTRKNLVHADVSIDDLQESLKGKSITPLGQYLKDDQLEGLFEQLQPFLDSAGKFLKEFGKSIPAIHKIQIGLKAQLAEQFSKADVTQQFSPEMQKAIVLDRNKIVIEKLQEQLQKNSDKKNIAIFYGAAHMPDLAKRLATMNFEQKSKRWMTAWQITSVEQEDSSEDSGPQPKEPQNREEEKKK